jgi:nitrile hydratase accessory protein
LPRTYGRIVMTIDPAAARHAAQSVPGVPCDAEGPVFREPWQAEAFAMVVALHERGLFGWDEWAAMLGEEIKAAQAAGDPDTGETYYHHWLAALERMVARKGIADRAMLVRYHEAWDRAADRTPHGEPIALTAKDFVSGW